MLNRAFIASLASMLLVFTVSFGARDEQVNLRIGVGQVFAQTIGDIVAPGSTLQKVTGNEKFTSVEAACWDDGYLLFADNIEGEPAQSRTFLMSPDGKISVIREGNGITTAIQPSGKGTYFCAEFEGRRIIEMDRSGKVLRVVADKCNGTPFVGPTSLILDKKGGIYFSDSRHLPDDIENVLNRPVVYYMNAGGSIVHASENIFFPNGLALSPDGATVYVTNPYGEEMLQFVYALEVNPDGTLKNARKFCQVELTLDMVAMIQFTRDFRGPCSPARHFFATSGVEGCVVDTSGNLYVATNLGIGIQVFDPSGKKIGNIPTDARVTGCTFGGTDMRTLYVTAVDGIYAVTTKIPGLRLAMGN